MLTYYLHSSSMIWYIISPCTLETPGSRELDVGSIFLAVFYATEFFYLYFSRVWIYQLKFTSKITAVKNIYAGCIPGDHHTVFSRYIF